MTSRGRIWQRAGLFSAAALVLLAFHLVGLTFLSGYRLDLGSLDFPTPGFLTLVAFWMPLGALSASLLALAIAGSAGTPLAVRLGAEWTALSDRRFLSWACLAGFAIPLAIRYLLLHEAPLTDDESAYRFAAELLARGRLWVPSPEMKIFFDQNFMINDGRLYPVYFLGWPALMVPGVWIGMPGAINPLLSALTVPPLFRGLSHFVGTSWARAGVLLFLTSPFLQVAAATQLSHTSCLMALTWCLWMYLRATGDSARTRDHAFFALAFATAFCIRPQSAVPIGLPLLASWALSVVRTNPARRWSAVLAFAVPSAVLAVLFLGALWAQNGAPWRVGYVRYGEYMLENKLRFTTFGPTDQTAVPGFDFSEVGPALARTTIGLFRLNADLFGWPSSLGLLILAIPIAVVRTRLFWGMLAAYVSLQFFQRDWGLDTFGPVHAFEMALPVMALTIAGLANLSRHLSWRDDGEIRSSVVGWGAFAPSLLAALIITAWLGFIPIRLQGVAQIASHLNVALRAPERAGIDRAVIFSAMPFAPPCGTSPSHFVFFRPVNDPYLANDVLWVNHVNPEEDRRLLASLSGDRPGYTMRWTSPCNVVLEPIDGRAPMAAAPR